MALRFPAFFDLHDNNCTIIGGDDYAYQAAKTFLQFNAKVTVISPILCPELEIMAQNETIRHIRRKYFRGDAANAYLCVAATDKKTNIDISVECKSRHIPVNVENPKEYGTFMFPQTLISDDFIGGFISEDEEQLKVFVEKLKEKYPDLWNK